MLRLTWRGRKDVGDVVGDVEPYLLPKDVRAVVPQALQILELLLLKTASGYASAFFLLTTLDVPPSREGILSNVVNQSSQAATLKGSSRPTSD